MEDKKIIVQLCGRLANQMFQYAFSKSLERHTGIKVVLDDSEETVRLNCFKCFDEIKLIKKTPYKRFLRKIIFIRNLRNKLTKEKITLKPIKEKFFNKFEPEFFEMNESAYIYDSFFQTEKYFSSLRDELLKDFELKIPLNNENKMMLNEIQNSNSVSMHIRRGDYVKHKDKFGVLPLKYYEAGLQKIAEKIQNLKIFVFSDDIKWVSKQIKFDFETVFVDINNAKKGYFDLELMKNCKHNIIANSSFSWWAAWLNQNPDKIVIAPSPWFLFSENDYDIMPSGWKKINVRKN